MNTRTASRRPGVISPLAIAYRPSNEGLATRPALWHCSKVRFTQSGETT